MLGSSNKLIKPLFRSSRLFKLSKKLEYALITLRYMSSKGEDLTTAKEVCQKFATPFDTTSKVMQIMNKKGFINSKQGVNGGYSLEINLDEISFMNLVSAIEKNTSPVDCLGNGKKCDQIGSCNIITPMQQLNDKLKIFLQHLTLEDLFNSKIELEAI